MQTPLYGTLTRFAITFDGSPEKPREWSGKIEMQLDGLIFDKQPIGGVAARVDIGSDRANVVVSDQLDEKKGALNAVAALPEKLDGFSKTSGSGRIDLLAPDLPALTRTLAQPVSGDQPRAERHPQSAGVEKVRLKFLAAAAPRCPQRVLQSGAGWRRRHRSIRFSQHLQGERHGGEKTEGSEHHARRLAQRIVEAFGNKQRDARAEHRASADEKK